MIGPKEPARVLKLAPPPAASSGYSLDSGLLAIPGVGPVVAAGWLVATAAGAAVGGTADGIIGALTQAGTSEEDMQKVCAAAAL